MNIIDQTGHLVNTENTFSRIVSIVPSQTELLFYLGLKNQIVGRTRFCIHPKNEVKQVKSVGGTKTLNLETLAKLKPNLIIANKEENSKEQIEWLRERFQVYTSDILNLEHAWQMIADIGVITNTQIESKNVLDKIKLSFATLPKYTGSVAYFIWNNPLMVAANGTFINDLLQSIGLRNVFENAERYPQTTKDELIERKPDYVFLSSEPYPFKQKHIDELQALLPNAQVLLVDGEMFSWYGSRLLYAAAYFKNLNLKLA